MIIPEGSELVWRLDPWTVFQSSSFHSLYFSPSVQCRHFAIVLIRHFLFQEIRNFLRSNSDQLLLLSQTTSILSPPKKTLVIPNSTSFFKSFFNVYSPNKNNWFEVVKYWIKVNLWLKRLICNTHFTYAFTESVKTLT